MNKVNIVSPSLTRIFFARMIDLILMSVSFFILSILYKVETLSSAVILTIATLSIYAIYFILFPYFIKGSTLGKLIFNIHVVDKQFLKPKFICFLYREFYFIFVPYIFFSICQFIRILIVNYYGVDGNLYSQIFYKVGTIFYSVWLAYVALTIVLQKDHLSVPDYKLGIKVVYYEKVDCQNENLNEIKEKNINFIKIVNTINGLPGYVGSSELQDIENIDYKELINKNENINNG